MPPSFSAKGIKRSGGSSADQEGGKRPRNASAEPIQVTIHKWGLAAEHDIGSDPAATLWQIQILQTGLNSIGYKFVEMAKEAVKGFDGLGEDADLSSLERQKGIRLHAGVPASQHDQDGVGVQKWRPVLYCSDYSKGLKFIDHLAAHKVMKNLYTSAPPLENHQRSQSSPVALPQGWTFKQSNTAPLPFEAVPPLSRRHLCLLVESVPGDGEYHHILSFYGGIWEFRSGFSALNVPFEKIDQDGLKETLRIVDIQGEDDLDIAKQVLEEALHGTPVCVFHKIPAELAGSDPVLAWVKCQASLYLHEVAAT